MPLSKSTEMPKMSLLDIPVSPLASCVCVPALSTWSIVSPVKSMPTTDVDAVSPEPCSVTLFLPILSVRVNPIALLFC